MAKPFDISMLLGDICLNVTNIWHWDIQHVNVSILCISNAHRPLKQRITLQDFTSDRAAHVAVLCLKIRLNSVEYHIKHVRTPLTVYCGRIFRKRNGNVGFVQTDTKRMKSWKH